jgi:hypothetical protein
MDGPNVAGKKEQVLWENWLKSEDEPAPPGKIGRMA